MKKKKFFSSRRAGKEDEEVGIHLVRSVPLKKKKEK
jgi:hypothetical protein